MSMKIFEVTFFVSVKGIRGESKALSKRDCLLTERDFVLQEA
jgi:hypothetical protein